MRYKLLPRRVSLLIYDDTDSINYVSSCQININGTHGTIDTLNGKEFYKFLIEQGLKPFLELGLTAISAAVSIPHLRLLKRMLKNHITVTEHEIIKLDEASLVWITMTQPS